MEDIEYIFNRENFFSFWLYWQIIKASPDSILTNTLTILALLLLEARWRGVLPSILAASISAPFWLCNRIIYINYSYNEREFRWLTHLRTTYINILAICGEDLSTATCNGVVCDLSFALIWQPFSIRYAAKCSRANEWMRLVNY